jgi:hypothetical protein
VSIHPHYNARPIPPVSTRLPVLHGSLMRRGWWPGVPRRCSACDGHLMAGGHTYDRDPEVSCLLCGRVAFEVRWDR